MMMKKLAFILFSLLLTVPSFAQEAEFKKAVSKNNKNEDGNYVADFSKQRFTEAEITSYAIHPYLLDDVITNKLLSKNSQNFKEFHRSNNALEKRILTN